MTNEELDVVIAQKVMRFKGEPEERPTWWASRNARGKIIDEYFMQDYEPTCNVEQALNALLKAEVDFQIEQESVTIFPKASMFGSFVRAHEGTSESIADAICKLLLMLLREKGDL